MIYKHPLQLICIGITSLLIGCGGSEQRHAMQGQVTKHGQPVQEGVILFLPTSSGPSAAGVISDGFYEFDTTNGPYAGSFRVLIGVEADPDESTDKQSNDSNSTDSDKKPENMKVSVRADPAAELEEAKRRRRRKEEPPTPPKIQWEFQYTIPEDGDDRKDFSLE